MVALTFHQIGSTFSRDTDVVHYNRYTGLCIIGLKFTREDLSIKNKINLCLKQKCLIRLRHGKLLYGCFSTQPLYWLRMDDVREFHLSVYCTRLRSRPGPARPALTGNRSRFCKASNFLGSALNEQKLRIYIDQLLYRTFFQVTKM